MKKKLLFFVSFVLVLTSIMCIGVFAESGSCGSKATYDLNTTTGELVIRGSGRTSNFFLGSAPWYSKRNSIKSVVIENGITSIGESAFAGCVNLVDVQIPDTVDNIGASVFSGCTSLKRIVLPQALKTIGKNCFLDCTRLDEIAFAGSTNQWNAVVKLSNWNKNTGVGTSDGTYSVVCLNDPTVLYSGKCGESTTWELDSEGILTISGSGLMYDYCSSMPEWYDVREQIKSVVITSGVTSVGWSAFMECTELAEITISPSVTYIGKGAFWGCTRLGTIDIPVKVNRIDEYAFYGCSSLTAINVNDSNAFFSDIDGVLFNKAVTKLVCCPDAFSDPFFDVPEGVLEIEKSAFSNCINILYVTLPDTLTKIGDGAFSGCTSLESISIPSSCKTINAQVFYGCESLSYVNLARSLVAIFEGAFGECVSLQTIHYMGTEQRWATISFADGWDAGAGNYTVEFATVSSGNYGDANEDGIVDNKDLVRIKKYLAAYDYETFTSSVYISPFADANGDGNIDNKDLVRIKKYLAAYDYDTGTSTVPLGP